MNCKSCYHSLLREYRSKVTGNEIIYCKVKKCNIDSKYYLLNGLGCRYYRTHPVNLNMNTGQIELFKEGV